MIIENNPEPVDEARPFGTITLLFETESERTQAEVLVGALSIYAQRNEEYRDNWVRMGWRGMLVRVRERAERLWDSLFWADLPETDYSKWSARKLDDAYDAINFLAFLIRAVQTANRDGEWWRR